MAGEDNASPGDPPMWFTLLFNVCLFGALGWLGWWGYSKFTEPETETSCERFAETAAEKLWKMRVRNLRGGVLALLDTAAVEISADEETAVEQGRSETDLGFVLQCTVTVTVYDPRDNTTETGELAYTVEPRSDGGLGYYVRLL